MRARGRTVARHAITQDVIDFGAPAFNHAIGALQLVFGFDCLSFESGNAAADLYFRTFPSEWAIDSVIHATKSRRTGAAPRVGACSR